MTFFPIPDSILKNATVLATDIDDTLTIDGYIPGENLIAISRLRSLGMKVFLVTGRTAGHGLSMTTYLDIDGAIAENGGVICKGETRQIVSGFESSTMENIRKIFEKIGQMFPQVRPTQDNFMRLTDQTFYVDDFDADSIRHAKQIAMEKELTIVYSSIHLHVCDPAINKGRTLIPTLESIGETEMEKVLTIGDSPNDEGFFDVDLFPNSIGVKNVEDYFDRMEKKPRYVLPKREGHGFAMLADALIRSKS